MPDTTDEAAVEAAARALCRLEGGRLNAYCVLHGRYTDAIKGYCGTGKTDARAALAAARPILDAQTGERIAGAIEAARPDRRADPGIFGNGRRSQSDLDVLIARRAAAARGEGT